MYTIGVFCTVADADSDLVEFTLANIPRHPAVAILAILYTGAVVPKSFGALSKRHKNVIEEHVCFGSGLDVSIEDGGYDQVSARNHAQKIVMQSKTDWIVRVDADEMILDAALDLVAETGHASDLIVLDYHTLLPGNRYWHDAKLERLVAGQRLLDPHLAIWRTALDLYDEECPVSVQTFANRTRHCNVRTNHIPAFRIAAAKGLLHLHFHCLLEKRNARTRTGACALTERLPAEAVTCLEGLGLDAAYFNGVAAA